jgi:AraC family transcriptional regulator
MDQIEEYLQRIGKVLIYIEEHLDDEMTIDELSKICYYSSFHFHRLFHLLVGETVHQYVKRLRMEKALGKLKYTDQSVTEIGLDAGYSTPSAFTKAFKQIMGKPPKEYRNIMTEKLKGVLMIEPDKIETIKEETILFIRKTGSYVKSPNDAWRAMREFIAANQLNVAGLRFFGISLDNPEITAEDKLRYDAAILAPTIKGKGEVGEKVLKGGKYAVFTHKGRYANLEKTFSQIFIKWLPASKEKLDETRDCFCEYLNMENIKIKPQELITKIYIPIA